MERGLVLVSAEDWGSEPGGLLLNCPAFSGRVVEGDFPHVSAPKRGVNLFRDGGARS